MGKNYDDTEDAIFNIFSNNPKLAPVARKSVPKEIPIKKLPTIISTGSLSLDILLDKGGLPAGVTVELFGPESTGKTTLIFHIIKEIQKLNGIVVYIDTENVLDIEYASLIGIDINTLLVAQPETRRELFEMILTLAASDEVDAVIVDSIAGIIFQENEEGYTSLEEQVTSQFMNKLNRIIEKTGTIVILTSQMRWRKKKYSKNSMVTTGGDPLKMYSKIRLKIKKSRNIKDFDDVIGNRVCVSVEKNVYKRKVDPPFSYAEFDIYFNTGISRESEIIDLGIIYNIIQKKGSWYSYYENNKNKIIGQGRDTAIAFLRENPELTNNLENLINLTSQIFQ